MGKFIREVYLPKREGDPPGDLTKVEEIEAPGVTVEFREAGRGIFFSHTKRAVLRLPFDEPDADGDEHGNALYMNVTGHDWMDACHHYVEGFVGVDTKRKVDAWSSTFQGESVYREQSRYEYRFERWTFMVSPADLTRMYHFHEDGARMLTHEEIKAKEAEDEAA